jgi:hypothetical protein
MTGISRSRWRRASWLCLAAACGGRAAAGRNAPGPAGATRVVPLDTAFVLETAGAPPPDTSVTFTAGVSRSIILRHGPPDNLVFAQLDFPPAAFKADSGRPVTVRVHPRPGIYGVDVTTSVSLAGGGSLTFKYARYFSAPARARAVYGSDVLYERALAIGRLQPNGQLGLLPSTRPASDNLRSALPGPGSYLVAAAP